MKLTHVIAFMIAGLALAGCIGPGRISADRVNFTEYLTKDYVPTPKCLLRVCMMHERKSGSFGPSAQDIILGSLREQFVFMTFRTELDSAYCDIGIQYEDDSVGNRADIYSAFTKEFLFFAETNYAYMGALICRALAEGSPLWERIPGSDVVAVREGRLKPKAFASSRPAVLPAAPPTPAPASDGSGVIRSIEGPRYKSRPQPRDFAIVVGIEKYSDLPDASYADRDAAAVRAHMEALGVPARNIVYLPGNKAVRSSLEKYLEDWLPKMATADSRVYFYFSGHGAPDPVTGETYLVPWDGDPDYLARTAYPVKRLYQKLSVLKAREVLVVLDACFSGAGGRSVLPKGARPLVLKTTMPEAGRLTVLTASASSEISGSMPEEGHGMFTYFLLKNLNEGKSDVEDIYRYLVPEVQDEAHRLNREQTPQLMGSKEFKFY